MFLPTIPYPPSTLHLCLCLPLPPAPCLCLCPAFPPACHLPALFSSLQLLLTCLYRTPFCRRVLFYLPGGTTYLHRSLPRTCTTGWYFLAAFLPSLATGGVDSAPTVTGVFARLCFLYVLLAHLKARRFGRVGRGDAVAVGSAKRVLRCLRGASLYLAVYRWLRAACATAPLPTCSPCAT